MPTIATLCRSTKTYNTIYFCNITTVKVIIIYFALNGNISVRCLVVYWFSDCTLSYIALQYVCHLNYSIISLADLNSCSILLDSNDILDLLKLMTHQRGGACVR